MPLEGSALKEFRSKTAFDFFMDDLTYLLDTNRITPEQAAFHKGNWSHATTIFHMASNARWEDGTWRCDTAVWNPDALGECPKWLAELTNYNPHRTSTSRKSTSPRTRRSRRGRSSSGRASSG